MPPSSVPGTSTAWSAAAVIGWRENLQSHLSVGKTITRPDFASLNPALSLPSAESATPAPAPQGNPGNP